MLAFIKLWGLKKSGVDPPRCSSRTCLYTAFIAHQFHLRSTSVRRAMPAAVSPYPLAGVGGLPFVHQGTWWVLSDLSVSRKLRHSLRHTIDSDTNLTKVRSHYSHAWPLPPPKGTTGMMAMY